jgi:tRNA A-37 threonylcarbamoyl transferase component Bud32
LCAALVESHLGDNTLTAYLEGKCDERRADAIHAHCDRCEDCRRILFELARRHSVVREPTGRLPLDSLKGALRSAIVDRTISQSEEFKGTRRFAIRRRLGAGGMGVVYEAFDRERGVVVALKVLRAPDEHSLLRFKNEFRSLADLQHRNLVRLGELFCEDSQWFFTMELVAGTGFLPYIWHRSPPIPDPNASTTSADDTLTGAKLQRILEARRGAKRYDEARLRASLTQLAQGIAALHAAGKVHRDIKPSNILVTREDRVVLLDFGLVTDADRQDMHGEVVGTAHYMAPEQAAGQAVGPEADWYGVGALLYEALTGRPPFEGATIDVLVEKQRNEAPRPRSVVPDVPSDLDALCADLLRREHSSRPRAAEVLHRLGEEAPAEGVSSAPSIAAERFVGRGRELRMLREAFADSAQRGIMLLVHGESGLGKSALVRRFISDLVAENAAIVLAGRCYERERVPFKAFDGIVDSLSRHLSRIDQVVAALMLPPGAAFLARIFPVLRRIPAMAEVAEPRMRVPDPLEARTRAFAALREILIGLTARQPLVLFIDDLQWADADSIALLRDVMHSPDAPALLLVGTVRSAAPSQMLAMDATALGEVRHLQLEPLSAAEGCELADSLLSASGASGVKGAAAIADEAGGHPLFIHELVRHLASASVHATGAVRLDEALWARVSQLEPTARTFLEVIAVAGERIPQQVAAEAAGLRLADLGEHLALLRTNYLVRTEHARGSDVVEPYHDRIREAILAHLDDQTRRHHHERLAAALQSSGAGEQDPRVLVRHLQGAGQANHASRQAERAARLAVESLAFDQAAELLQIALRSGAHDDAERRALSIRLGDVLVNAGRGSEAAQAYLSAAEGADAAVRLECHRRAAEQLLASGHIDRGLKALAAVLAEVGLRLPSSPRRALVSLLWQRTKLRLRGLTWKAKDEGQIAAQELTQLDIYRTVAVGLAMVDNIRGADFQARGLLLALRTGERRRIGRALAFEASYLASQGSRNLRKAGRLLDEAQRISDSRSDAYLAASIKGSVGVVSYEVGSFRDAARQLAEADPIFRDSTDGMSWEMNTVRILRLFALRRLGLWNELIWWFDEYVRDASRRGDRYAEISLRRGCNAVWLAQGLPDEAERDLEPKAWVPHKGGYHLQHWYALRARTEIALYRGVASLMLERLREDFEAARRSLLTRIQIVRSETFWLRGRLVLAAASGTSPANLAEAKRMVRRLEREGVGYAAVWARLLGAGIAYRERHSTRANELLREAAALAEKADMRFEAVVARRRLAEIAGGSTGAVAEVPGVEEPDRMSELVVPGFALSRAHS